MYRRKIPILIITLVIKAGLVSVGSLAVSQLLAISNPTLIIFASLLGITPSFYRGLKRGLRNISVTVLGGFLSLLLVGVLGIENAYLSIPLGVMFLLGAFYLFGLMDQFPLGVFTFIIMGFDHPGGLWETGLARFGAIALGLAVATGVNYLTSLFRYRNLYAAQLEHILKELSGVYRQIEELFRIGDSEGMEEADGDFHLLFRQIGVFRDELADLKSELRMRRSSGGLTYKSIIWLARAVEKVEMISHYLYDITSTGPGLLNSSTLDGKEKDEMASELSFLSRRLEQGIREFKKRESGDQLKKMAKDLKEKMYSPDKFDKSKRPPQLISLRESLYNLRLELSRLFEYMANFF